MKMKTAFLLAPLALGALASSQSLAQVQPDAGQTVQELAPKLQAPRKAPEIAIEKPAAAKVEEGGPEVEIQDISITGNTVFDTASLREQIGPVAGKMYDYAALRGIAGRLTDFYRGEGYPFARVYLPPQMLENGLLSLTVVEGRYGKISTEGEAVLAERAKAFLSGLKTGDVIESDALERATLVLDDQPGIKAAPVIRPGAETGTGDLNVVVARTPVFSGEVGVDNSGNRYNGEYRGKVDLQLDSPFLFGDQITLKNLLTDEEMWLGSLGYSAPLGSSGLRGSVNYTQTNYELGKQFADLDATGYAKISSVGVSYPLYRTQRTNVSLAGSYLHKELQDRQGSTASDNTKSSESAAVSAQFDRRDSLLGGGITYGSIGVTQGSLHLDEGLQTTDRTTARTKGAFGKANLDVARLQVLPQDFSAFARISAQRAFKNLDSSEGFGLGGPSGVRAFPVGEGYGDEGWLTQLELRYTVGAFAPFLFYDAGSVRLNRSAWENSQNERNISGAGFGLRVYYEGLKVDASVAWTVQGGDAQSDTLQRRPRGWFSVGYAF